MEPLDLSMMDHTAKENPIRFILGGGGHVSLHSKFAWTNIVTIPSVRLSHVAA